MNSATCSPPEAFDVAIERLRRSASGICDRLLGATGLGESNGGSAGCRWGYVGSAGDENVASIPDHDDLAALRRAIVAREGVGAERKYLPFKPLWQRTLIVLAGPAANFLLGVTLFTAFFLAFGEPVSTSRVTEVVAASAAARAGSAPGRQGAPGPTAKPTPGPSKICNSTSNTEPRVPIDFTVDSASGRPAASCGPPGHAARSTARSAASRA